MPFSCEVLHHVETSAHRSDCDDPSAVTDRTTAKRLSSWTCKTGLPFSSALLTMFRRVATGSPCSVLIHRVDDFLRGRRNTWPRPLAGPFSFPVGQGCSGLPIRLHAWAPRTYGVSPIEPLPQILSDETATGASNRRTPPTEADPNPPLTPAPAAYTSASTRSSMSLHSFVRCSWTGLESSSPAPDHPPGGTKRRRSTPPGASH